MPHLVETFQSIGFSESQISDFMTVFSFAEQEKLGSSVELPTKANNHARMAKIEEEAKSLDLAAELSNLQKKGIVVDSTIVSDLVKTNNQSAKELLLLNKLLQTNLLRPAGTERQQLTSSDVLEQHRELLTSAFSNLGLIEEVKPQNKKPDVLLVLGAAQSGFTERLNATVQYLEEEHVKPSKLYLLGGQRLLWAVAEEVTAELVAERIANGDSTKSLAEVLAEVKSDFDNRAKQVTDRTDTKQINAFRDSVVKFYQDTYNIKWPTELDMMVRVTEKADLKKKGLIVVPVDTPMQPDEAGNLTKRPNTRDTIVSFKTGYASQISCAAGSKISVLAVSSQPNIMYQTKPIEEVLGTGIFSIEVVGKSVDKGTYQIRGAFDGLARSVFAGLGMALSKLVLPKKDLEKPSASTSWAQTVSTANAGNKREL